MAIEMFTRMRGEMRMMEQEVEKVIHEAKKLYEENQMLLRLVDNLQNELKTLKNDTGTNDSCSSKRDDNEN